MDIRMPGPPRLRLKPAPWQLRSRGRPFAPGARRQIAYQPAKTTGAVFTAIVAVSIAVLIDVEPVASKSPASQAL